MGAAFHPSLAFASTATTTPADGIVYTAGAGETNDVTVSFVSTVSVRIVDLGATIQASGGCTSETATSVVCAGDSGLIDLGDMNDTAFVNEGFFTVNGGDGNDTLELGLAGGTVNGGAGNDTLTGSSGGGSISSNRSDGGPGDDFLQSGSSPQTMIGGPGADTFVGGPSQDCVDYSARTEPVYVTIADGNANDGEAGENDRSGRRSTAFSAAAETTS